MANLNKTNNFYSNDKYWSLPFIEIEFALQANDLKTVDRLFHELKSPTGEKHANSLEYYKANYYRKKIK